MDIRNLVSENVYSQLSLYAGRLRNNIDSISNEIDTVASFIQICNDYQDDEGVPEGAPIVLNIDVDEKQLISDFEDDILSNGITIANAYGELVQFYLDDAVTGIRSIHVKDSIGDYIWLYEDAQGKINLLHDIAYDFRHNGVYTIYDLFMSRWSAFTSEMSMWYDVVTTFLSGGWNNVAELTTVLQDRILNGSINITTAFQDLKDSVAAASSSGASGIAQAILTKLGLAANFTVTQNDTIDYQTVNNWSISDLNWNTISKGLLTASQYLGQLLLFVGGPIIKAIGTGLMLTTKLVDYLDTSISTAANAEVNDKGWLSSWYGDVHLGYEPLSSFKLKFPKVTTLPAIIDTGFVKILASPNTVNGNDVIEYRIYDYALYSPNLLHLLIQDITEYFEITNSNIVSLSNKFVSQTYEWIVMNANYCYNPIDYTRMNTLYNKIVNHCNLCAIDTETFDNLSDSDKRESYMASLILFSYYLTFTTTKVQSIAGNIVRVLPIWFFEQTAIGTAWDNITKWLTGTAEYPNSEYNGSISVGVTPFEMLTIPLCGQYVKYSTITAISWAQLVEIKNCISNILNGCDFNDIINGGIWSANSIYHVEKNGTNFYQVSYEYNTHNTKLDFDNNINIYNDNWSYANGCQSIIRYNPPHITYTLAQFIRIMGISVGISIVIGSAVIAYKRLTRNKRQANLYARYNNAVNNYNENPNTNTFKTLKKTTRLLKRDITFFGSSKYLSVLSGAAFGWGVDGANTAATTLTGLLNTGQSYLTGSSSSNSEEMAKLRKLISG